MIRMRIVGRIQFLLPFAEIVQGFVRVHGDIQLLLGQERILISNFISP